MTSPMTVNTGYRLIADAVNAGLRVRVFYEDDDDAIYTGTEMARLWDEVTACDAATVHILKQDDDTTPLGWAYLLHINDPDETVSDCDANGWVNWWWDETDGGSTPLDTTPASSMHQATVIKAAREWLEYMERNTKRFQHYERQNLSDAIRAIARGGLSDG